MTDAPLLIVGAGLAGYTLARELRKLTADLPITLVTADSGDFYSKPMLSNALAQGQTAATLVQMAAAEQAAKLNIDLRPRSRALSIRRAERVLETDAGALPYGHLVLALGASPRKPGFPGAEAVISVNSLDDYARFRERLRPEAHVCILGAGLVGCEFANDLALAGYRVTLVEANERPLQSMLPEALSTRLRGALAALGVEWRAGAAVSALRASDSGYVLSLADGVSLAADLVLSAIGLEANVDLARAAGLEVDRGIVVDTTLTTRDPAIHALGDCARVGGLVLPYVLPLMQQARVLAASLAGTPTRLVLPALPVAVKTPACPLVVCPPPASADGAWRAERDDDKGASYHYLDTDGNLLGFALCGDACPQRRQLAARAPALIA